MSKSISSCLILLTMIISINPSSDLCGQETSVDEDFLQLGGAIRYVYMNNSWNKSHNITGGRAAFDTLILTAKGQYQLVDFNIENRYYAEAFGGFMLRNGYAGLSLTENLKLKVGMPRTPFGIMPFTGNSFMFNMQYYIGFEDDADIGALLEYTGDHYEAQLSFAKNAEDVVSSGNKRYAYDINGDQEEINQLTARTAYYFGKDREMELGVSVQYGGIYNEVTENTGDRWATALHALIQKGPWDLQAEVMYYEFSPDDPLDRGFIEMGAFAADYEVANEGLCYSVCLGYKIDVNHRLLNDIKFYNDFSALHKAESEWDDSYMNVVGCMIHTGPIYMLIDYVYGKNQPWIGTNYGKALSVGGDTEWNTRFNVSFGVYF